MVYRYLTFNSNLRIHCEACKCNTRYPRGSGARIELLTRIVDIADNVCSRGTQSDVCGVCVHVMAEYQYL